MPNVIKMYNDFHAKGVEFIGISSDDDLKALKSFLASNTGMAWPQLFSATHLANGWHPLTGRMFVDSIPTMFVIDKTGTCRGVGYREVIEALLPQLLEEDGKPHPKTAPAPATKPAH